MRFPWSKREPESRAGGNFSDAVIHQIEAQAASKATGVGTTAAVEAAAGALSRAFAGAEVVGPDWAAEAVTPGFLALVGRNLVRGGASMHTIEMAAATGRVELLPVSAWNFENSGNIDHPASPSNWRVRATSYGPSSSSTRLLTWDEIVFMTWGVSPGTPYVGTGPLGWASTTARTMSETERSLADEAAGPVGNLVPVPQDGGDGDEDTDPLAPLKGDISRARGQAILLETTSQGWGEGQASAPHSDWKPHRLGPNMPEAMVQLQAQAFEHVLAACGTVSALFTNSDGTSQREGLRRWHLGTVRPLAKLLEHELSAKLETPIRLKFDAYPTDLAGRASAFKALVTGGMDVAGAAAVSGLLIEDP